MKFKIQVISTLVLLSLSAYAQKVKYLDIDGKKTSKKQATFKVITNPVDENHNKLTSIRISNDEIVSEGIFLKEDKDVKDGYYREYHYNGEIKLEENYVNNVREGEYTEYHFNGQKYITSEYVNGDKVGAEIEYSKEGSVVRKSTYNKEKIGEELEYYPSGAIKEKGKYNNGKLEGIREIFYESGVLKYECRYKAGEIQGESKSYFENGNLERMFTYVNDELNGDFKYYYETGELEAEGKMKSGKRQGYFYSYYKSGVKRRHEYYTEGKRNKELGKCFATDGSDTTYFPRTISPLINNNPLQKEIIRILSNNFKYPKVAREMGIQDKIYVAFVFTKEGTIDNVRVVNPTPYNDLLGDEAMRIVKLIGNEKITNGFFEGKPTDKPYNVPIRFKMR